MMMDEALIERIVDGVLERMRTPPSPVRAASSESKNGQSYPQSGRSSRGNSELILNEPVITGDLLEQRLDGHRRIRLAPKAVLTPSARDVVKWQDVSVVQGSSTESPTSAKPRWLAIVLTASSIVQSAAEDLSRSSEVAWDRELVGDVREAAEKAVGELCRGAVAGVVVFAEAAEAVACLANRHRSVRAAVVNDLDSVERVKQSLGANLFVVNPQRTSYFELRNLLRATVSDECPKPPFSWEE